MPTSQRPTISPPFDPEAFARESESKLRVSAPALPSTWDGAPGASEPLDEELATRPAVDVAFSMKVRRAMPRAEAAPPSRDDASSSDLSEDARAIALDGVPLLTVSFAELRTMALDHRGGFLISLIDGTSSVEMILDVCGMPPNEALVILKSFSEQGIIAIK